MKPTRSRLDDWLVDSPVSDQDLSLFRILYALFTLLTLWRSDYAASLPPVAFDPPGGPFALLGSAPPVSVIWALQALLCFSLSALAIGWRTRFAALAAAVLQVVIYGIGYSYGKIDHTIFLPLVPLLLSFSAWGSNFSVDAHRARFNRFSHTWAPRCLAIAIGIGMLAAGLSKVRGGWLSWDTQATFGYLVAVQDVYNAPLETVEFLKSIDYRLAWEILDYATVILECGMVFAALSWRLFYVGLAALAVFHLSIWITIGISFPYNLPVYAAFIPWSRIGPAIPIRTLGRLSASLASSAAARLVSCAGIASFGLLLAWVRPPWFVPAVYAVALVAAALVGFGYLAFAAWRVRALGGKLKPRHPPGTPAKSVDPMTKSKPLP